MRERRCGGSAVLRILRFRPPGGELTQDEIGYGLETALELGRPAALCQLPQFTRNETPPNWPPGWQARILTLLCLRMPVAVSMTVSRLAL
ncbi:MAG: hypothetical protein LBG43_01840 [Treponema sp.]|nr:hypothetical protein [Treponema sp.]